MKKLISYSAGVKRLLSGHFLFVSLLCWGAAAGGCGRPGEDPGSESQHPPSRQGQVSSQAATASTVLSPQQALDQINYLFQDELLPVQRQQVHRVNRQQFLTWLRNSKIAAAEKEYLKPLLASKADGFLLLEQVTMQDSGIQATIALVAVPPELYPRYATGIVLRDLNKALLGKLCSWFACDNLDPSMCLCLYQTGIVPVGQNCPSNECDWERGCTDPNGEPCGGILQDVIDAF
jgi:hypothetical protein